MVILKYFSLALFTINLGFLLWILQQDQFFKRNMFNYKKKTDHFFIIVYLPYLTSPKYFYSRAIS